MMPVSIVGVRSTEHPQASQVGIFAPQHHRNKNEEALTIR